MNEEQIRLEDYINLAQRHRQENHKFAAGLSRKVQIPGWHIYGELQLNLELSAPSDLKAAQEYIHIIQVYASLAYQSGLELGCSVLEVQGERIHLFLPSLLDENVDDVYAICCQISDGVYSTMSSLTDGKWQGFKMAADHGKTVLIPNIDIDDSFLSLSVAANDPAKVLPNTGAGELSLKSKYSLTGTTTPTSQKWITYKLKDRPQNLDGLIKNSKHKTASDWASPYSEQMQQEPEVFVNNIRSVEDDWVPSTTENFIVQGICLRSDLDGFTSKVKSAFENDQVDELTDLFYQIMGYAKDFSSNLQTGKSVQLPWAGDCASFVIFPTDADKYQTFTFNAPAKFPAKWHDVMDLDLENGEKWSARLDGLSWAVGAAGGPSQNEGFGSLIISHISCGERVFRVVSGWGAKSSSKALDSGEVKGGDTVISRPDHAELSDYLKPLFTDHKPQFKISKEQLSSGVIATAATTEGITSPSIPIPGTTASIASRPHYETS
jgi:hypothetical protein